MNNERRASDSKTFGQQIKGTFNNTALRGGRRIVIESRLCIISHHVILHQSPYGNWMDQLWFKVVSNPSQYGHAASCKKRDAQNIYRTEQILKYNHHSALWCQGFNPFIFQLFFFVDWPYLMHLRVWVFTSVRNKQAISLAETRNLTIMKWSDKWTFDKSNLQ